MTKHILLILLILYEVNCQAINSNSYFANTAVLRSPDVYTLYWNYTNEDITFKAVAKTNGWVGFGISPNGGMENSDMILAYTESSGAISFKDSHTENSKTVITDVAQNWKRLFYSNTNGVTTVIFTRKLKICSQVGSEVNINIEPTAYVIFAWGNGVPGYHGASRGSRSLPLLSALNGQALKIEMNEVVTADFNVTTTLPNNRETTYFCKMFRLPADWNQVKQHIIRHETFATAESMPYVHHWLMYQCSPEYETVFLKNNTEPRQGICADGTNPEWDLPQKYCNKISFGWAVGGDLVQDFPAEFGYPVGGSPREFKYFFLQMHYENPNRTPNVAVSSVMKIYATKALRPKEFGIFTAGTLSIPRGIIIPQNIERLSLEYQCRKKNMERIFGSGDNVTIFAQLPHTHLAGRQVFSKIVRDNKEIEYIANNKYYDFNYQYTNFLQKPVVLKRNDSIAVNCVYSTKGRTKTTYGGLGTNDEMCLNFIWYYPRNIDFDACYDFVLEKEWYGLFDYLNKTGEINWKINTVTYENFFEDSMKAIETSSLVNRTDYLQKIFQDFYDNVKRTEYSPGQAGFPEFNVTRVERITSDPCYTQTTTVASTTKSNLLSGTDRLAPKACSLGLLGLLVALIKMALFY